MPAVPPAPGPPPPAPPAPGLGEAAAGFAVGLLLSSIAATVASSATGYRASSASGIPVVVTVAGVLGLWAGLIGAVVFAARSGGRRGEVAAHRRDRPGVAAFVGLRLAGPLDVVGGIAAGLASQYLLLPLLYLPAEAFDHSLARRLSQPAHRDTAAAHGVVPVIVLVLVLVVGAPVVEEVFFRGLVLRGLSARFGGGLSISVTALLFALAHFELLQLAGLAAFGVVLGTLARRTGRLGPSIVAHATFNAAAVVSLVHLSVM